MKKSFYALIMDNRSFLMSMAIIWVMLSHTPFGYYGIPVFSFLSKIGYGGVDIFMLISGMGIYTSLFRCSDMISFYKKRLIRIMPSYIIVTILAFATYLFLPAENYHSIERVDFYYFADLIGNITCTTFFFGRRKINWYVQAIMWIYFMSPILYVIVNRCNSGAKKLGLFMGMVLFNIPLYNCDAMTMSARLILYVIGMFIAKQECEGKETYITKKAYILLSILSIVGVVWLHMTYAYREEWLSLYGLHFYPFVVIVPGLVYNGAMIYETVISKTPHLIKCFSVVGKCTFEIYLANIYILSCGNFNFSIPYRLVNNASIRLIMEYCILILFAIIGGCILQKVSELMLNVAHLRRNIDENEN